MCFCTYINKFKTTTRENMGKNIKIMPLPKSIPPGKGGKPYGKKSKSFI